MRIWQERDKSQSVDAGKNHSIVHDVIYGKLVSAIGCLIDCDVGGPSYFYDLGRAVYKAAGRNANRVNSDQLFCKLVQHAPNAAQHKIAGYGLQNMRELVQALAVKRFDTLEQIYTALGYYITATKGESCPDAAQAQALGQSTGLTSTRVLCLYKQKVGGSILQDAYVSLLALQEVTDLALEQCVCSWESGARLYGVDAAIPHKHIPKQLRLDSMGGRIKPGDLLQMALLREFQVGRVSVKQLRAALGYYEMGRYLGHELFANQAVQYEYRNQKTLNKVLSFKFL